MCCVWLRACDAAVSGPGSATQRRCLPCSPSWVDSVSGFSPGVLLLHRQPGSSSGLLSFTHSSQSSLLPDCLHGPHPLFPDQYSLCTLIHKWLFAALKESIKDFYISCSVEVSSITSCVVHCAWPWEGKGSYRLPLARCCPRFFELWARKLHSASVHRVTQVVCILNSSATRLTH